MSVHVVNLHHSITYPNLNHTNNGRKKKPQSSLNSTVNQLPKTHSHITTSNLEYPNTYSSYFLNGRSKKYTIKEANQLHSYIIKSNSDSNIYYINSIIHIYAVNGDLVSAHKMFDKMPNRDVVSWTTLVDGYAKVGKMVDAQLLFDSMPERNLVSWNVLISGYGKCGDVDSAQRVFDEMGERDIVSWNSLISCYGRNGLLEEAFRVFFDGLVEGVVRPNKVTFLSVLTAIAESGCVDWGKCVHSFVLKEGIGVDNVVCSAIINMYCKCECLDMAFQVFERNKLGWNAASWNPMLTGLVQNKRFEEALDLFREMQLENIEPDYVTMVAILPAITYLEALSLGKWVHSYIQKKNVKVNATLGSALVDMYSKCGCIELALAVFNEVDDVTTQLCNAMITGLAIHGRGKDALELFDEMQVKNVEVDDVTVSVILNACSHSGLVEDGLSFFSTIKDVYRMTPKIQHYGCIVDILGRAGRLDEAKDLICNRMSIQPDVIMWKSLLGACKIHGNIEIGEFAAKHVMDLSPDDSSSYVLLSSLYDAAGRSNDAILMRKKMINAGVKKEPGFSSIELGGKIHKFLVGDRSHPESSEIYVKLNEIRERLTSKGYVPNKKLVLFDLHDEEKEDAIFHHSEKLAVAFGLINNAGGESLRIGKNLRICSDCHVFMKLVSDVYGVGIVVRDHSRFHHFVNGKCSCMDHW